MAKNNRVKWIGLGLTALGILAVVIATFVWAQAEIEAVDIKADGIKEDMGELKEEGCLPARGNTNTIGRIETRLETMQTEQTQAFSEILRRLPNE